MAPLTIHKRSGIVGILLDNIVNNWYIVAPLALILAATIVLVYRLLFHPLAKFPGPLEARLFGSWRNKRFWRGTWHQDVLEVHKRYGPVVRIAPNELSVVDENVTKQLYGHGTKALKTNWYATWDVPGVGHNVFAVRDKHIHSFLRKRLSAVYSMSAMLRYEQFIQSCLGLLMARLRAHAEAGRTVDMAEWTDALAFDVAGELAYGAPLGHLEMETDVMGIRAMIHKGFFLMSNAGHYFGQSLWFTHPIIGRISRLVGAVDPFGDFSIWTQERVVERMTSEGKAQREDMLHHFLNMKKSNGEPADMKEILAEAQNIIGAGADTTSIAMKACLYYMCKNPETYRAVQKEVDSYYEDKQLKQPITYHQTQELPLLCAVVRESIRLFPSIPYPLPRYAPAALQVDGKVIPPGTSVSVSAIAANRNPDVWGSDADEFKPSRWMESEDKTRYLNANDMTFGGNGPRMCIGRNLALVEVHKFVAQFVHHFDAQFVNPEKPWTIHTQWFANQHDMHVKIRYRG